MNRRKEDDYKTKWIKEQIRLSSRVITSDSFGCKVDDVRYVGGVDISFFPRSTRSVGCIVVYDIKKREIVYEDYLEGEIDLPYIPGLLAFREFPILEPLINRAKRCPTPPQIILVDGNGMLHFRKFGSACHLGVLCDVPTIGVGKKLLCVDGISAEDIATRCSYELSDIGDTVKLIGHSGTIYGVALRSTLYDHNEPIYISIGHKVCLDSAIKIVIKSLESDSEPLPEPVNQADLLSRDFVAFCLKKVNTKRKVPRMRVIPLPQIEEEEEEEEEEERGLYCYYCDANNNENNYICWFCERKLVN